MMIADFVAWIFTLFVVDPLQAEMQQRFESANASQQVIQQSQQCLATQGPRLLEKAGNEPGWAITTAVGITTGWTSPASLLDSQDPNCAAVAALLQGDGAAAEGGQS